MTSEDAINIYNLTKIFNTQYAINNISLNIPRGVITGILGGNGAGKTTLLSMILGLLLPTSGKIYIFGHDIATERHKILHRINFESPYVDMPLRLSVKENLLTYARLYNVPNKKQCIEELCEAFHLTDFINRPLSELSSGQRTRTNIAKSLINKPELLLLDEPTASLDPSTGAWIRDRLMSYCKDYNAAILFTSHNMLEVERICDHLYIMKKGNIIDKGTPQDIIQKYDSQNLEEVFLLIDKGQESSPYRH